MILLDTLINKQDTFEIVRDQIAAILVAEIANQQVLAEAAAEDPEDWKLRIFTERSNPWEIFDNNADERTPIVNIWYSDGSFPKNEGNVVERQAHDATFNIDCYGYGISKNNPAGGHDPGDKEAALEVQRTIRLVRNILMSNINTNLQFAKGNPLRPWIRWPQSITIFQPAIEKAPVPHVVGARFAFNSKFNEFSPQATPETLEQIFIDMKRTEDGQIVLEADFDFNP